MLQNLARTGNYQHPVLGALSGIAQPLRLDRDRMPLRRPPPLHGEHTAEVLQELGYSYDQIRALSECPDGQALQPHA